MVIIQPLQWSEDMKPCSDCRYDHCTAETEFGRFLITWKSWKSGPWQDMGIGFDETPWGEPWYGSWSSVDEAKADAQSEINRRIWAMIKGAN